MTTVTSIEWTERTWNPVTGCTKVSQGCKHCLGPETPVLYADMTWRPIGEVSEGDRLVGFDEGLRLGRNRAIRESTVERVWRSVQPALRLRIGETEIITTAKHRWLCEPRPWWRTTDRLRIGVRVRVFGNRLSNAVHSEDYMSGYVAGMTLGDGTFRFDPSWRSDKLGFPQMYWRVAVADKEILQRLTAFLGTAGVAVETRPFHSGELTRKPMWKVETRAKSNLQSISDLCVERNTPEWRAGWLGGMFDAEGSHDQNLRISQKDVAVLERGSAYAASFGIRTRIEHHNGSAATLRIEGGTQEKANFLTVARPVLQRKIDDLFGRRLDAGLAEVTALELIGDREVVDIQTSTRTFIAAGVCTHNCYAERIADRFWGDRPFTEVRCHPERLDYPKRIRKPTMFFVNSMSDLFHPDVPDDFVEAVFAVMRACERHTFQILTKRSERLAQLGSRLNWPANVWIGVSVEDSNVINRIDHLRGVPAAVRFLSLEPLIGPLDDLDLRGIGWVIVGGESGPGARPVRVDWVRSIKRQCRAARVPFFFKQWGGVFKKQSGRLLDGKIYDEFPLRA